MFALLFEKGRRQNHKNLQLIVLEEGNEEQATRFAVCVSRRFGNSVQRNRLKRILRAAVLGTLPAVKAGRILAVLPRGDSLKLKTQDMQAQFRSLCSRMDLLEIGPHA